MKARISNPVLSVHGVVDALRTPGKAGAGGGPPKATTHRVPLRAGSPPAHDDDQFSRASRNRPSPDGSWD